MRSAWLVLVFFVGCLSHAVQAQHPIRSAGIKIVGFPKEGRLEADGSGHYATLVRDLLIEAGYTDKLITVPVKRALRFFENETDICLVPVSKMAVFFQYPDLTPDSLIEGRPIDFITGHIVTPPGTNIITDPNDLNGKVMAAWVGVHAKVFFPNVDVRIIHTESEESAILMLHSGRVDAIWGWIPDAFILYEKLGLGTPNMAIDTPIFGSSAHIVCRTTEKGKEFIKNMDVAIDTYRKNGNLKKILGRHARIVGVDVPFPNPTHDPEN